MYKLKPYLSISITAVLFVIHYWGFFLNNYKLLNYALGIISGQ